MVWRTRWTDDDGERGSMHVMTIPVAVGLLTVATLVITMMGSATNDRRQAGTAADAAAIAAAQAWDDHLGGIHGLHRLSGDRGAFWGLFEEILLTVVVEREMYVAAEEYAERNGAELVDMDVDPDRLQVSVRVRHEDEVPVAETRAEAGATAQIRLQGGLCLGGDGLGWVIDDECVIRADSQGDEEGGPDEGDDGQGEEPWSPPDVGTYTSRIVLVG